MIVMQEMMIVMQEMGTDGISLMLMYINMVTSTIGLPHSDLHCDIV